MKPDLALLDLSIWTPIARHSSRFGPRWEVLDGAPVTPEEARAMQEAGRLLTAQRRVDGRMELVVKLPKSPTLPLRKATRAA